MMEIQLTKGQEATVDDRDYEELSKVKWCVRVNGKYAGRWDGKQWMYMHRAIWERHNGQIPKDFEIDHINGNGLDNRLENLRLCNKLQNQANRHKVQAHSSKFKGVSRFERDGNWRARVDKKLIGYFDTEEEAARAYDKAALEKWGEYAKLNFPTSYQ